MGVDDDLMIVNISDSLLFQFKTSGFNFINCIVPFNKYIINCRCINHLFQMFLKRQSEYGNELSSVCMSQPVLVVLGIPHHGAKYFSK